MSKKIKLVIVALVFMVLLFICNKVQAAEITQTLTNAPHNNATYCDNKLPIKRFDVAPSSSNPGTASNYPTSFYFQTGSYDESRHTYTKRCPISFSGTTFSEYGDYLFELTPVGDTAKYYVNVFVDNTGVTVDSLIGVGNTDTSNKEPNPNITIPNPNTNLKIDKIVKGNMADVDKKFTFSVKIDGYEGDTYAVTAPTGNATSHVVERANSELVGRNYTIAHNESVTISNVPVGTNYTINETAENDYTTKYQFINRSGAAEQTGGAVTDVAKETEAENEVKFINTNNIDEPATGIFYNVAPFIAVIGLAVVGIVLMRKTKKK